MINIALTYDSNAGILKIADNSKLDDNIIKGIIKVRKPSSRIDLTSSTTPTLNQFLDEGFTFNIPAKVDQVITVEYMLLVPLEGTMFNDKETSIVKLNIFNEAKKVFHVYTGDKLYQIDKENSTMHDLIVTEPIQKKDELIYLAYYVEECITATYNISRKLKEEVSNLDCKCMDCKDNTEKINKAMIYIDALDSASCDEQEKFLSCLKELFNISC